MKEPQDELAARRAAKGIVTIKIGDKVHELKLDPSLTIDPLATLRARKLRTPKRTSPKI